MKSRVQRVVRWGVLGLALPAAGYAAIVSSAWLRYGRPRPARAGEEDPLLDRFMPEYEVAERHHIHVNAPADVTMAAAVNADLQASPIVRLIIKTRELVLGAQGSAAARTPGLLAEVQALGWRVLAEDPGREIVMGAVTQPWLANVVFRGLPPEDFAAFHEPDYVKIAWTLRVDPIGPAETIFRTETRVMTTDRAARRRFRWYWARFSAGIIVIRWFLLPQVKRVAERAESAR